MSDHEKGTDGGSQFLNSSSADWGVGIAIGMAFGVALGVALSHIGIGIALGAAFAVVYALMMGDIKRRRDEDGRIARDRTPRD